MKTLLRSFLVLLLVYTSANAQWVHISINGAYRYSDAVNDQIFWAGRSDVTGTSCTTDGGQTWEMSTFTDPKGWPVYCIDALNHDTAFTTTSTIYKTTDGGTTWTAATGVFNNALSFPNVIHFFDQNNGVAMGDPVEGYFEIYTTTNGGDNWVRVPSGNIPAALTDEIGIVSQFAVYNNTIWFGTFATTAIRIFRSTDMGYTWTVLNTFPGGLTSWWPRIAFRDSLHEIAFTEERLCSRTSDGGMTWTTDSLPSWVEFASLPAYIPGTLATYVVNAIGLIGKEEQYISLISTDDGVTWKRMDSWQSSSVTFAPPIARQQWTSPNFGWACLPEEGIYKWPGYSGKHIWKAGYPLKYGTLAASEIGDTLEFSIGNFGTLPTTINAMNFSSAHFTLINPPSLPIVLQPWSTIELNVAFTPQSRGNFNDSIIILSDAENVSSLSVTLSGKALEFTPPLPDLIYAASDSLYSMNISNLTASSIGWFDGPRIDGLAVRPTDSVLVGISTSTSSTLYKIDPIVGGCLPILTIPVGQIRAIAYSKTGTLFAGGKNGNLYTINTETGDATLIGSAAGTNYYSFSFNPIDGKLYASVASTTPKDGIYTVDTLTGAATLIGKTGDSKATPCIAFNTDGTLYGLKGIGTETNKLISISTTDGSGTEIGTLGKKGLQAIIMSKIIVVPVELTSFNASLIGKDVQLIWSTATELNNYGFEIQRKAFDGDFATVAFVKGQGTTTQKSDYSFVDKNLDGGKYYYRLKQVDLDGKFEFSNIVEVEVISITSYSLEQNYPNPFNPSTTINYGLKEKSNVRIILLNSLGEEIAVLVNEGQDKGYHKVEFDGSKLSSGVYFYQIKAGNFINTKKMILLR